MRSKAPPFPFDRFSSIEELCFAAVRKFSPIALRFATEELSAGARSRPVEAQYQDEFYRACYSVLGGDIYLTSEWAGEMLGRVDFQIKSVGWAIECVREGNRLQEHIDRFQEGGRYYPSIQSGEIQDYIILDFRKSKPRTARGIMISIPFLFV